jgi:ABC-type nickel/cobalt efflux system permease component RcnA
MRLLTAHKILISTAAVFFFFFGLWELRNYSATADAWAIARAVLYLVIAVGFGVYFKNLDRLYK